MAEETSDITMPLTPGKIQSAVEHIVEQTFPRPRQELCIPVGEMERRLAAYAGELVQAVYNDAASIAKDARDRLARHLYIDAVGDGTTEVEAWDTGAIGNGTYRKYLAKADAILAVINTPEGR